MVGSVQKIWCQQIYVINFVFLSTLVKFQGHVQMFDDILRHKWNLTISFRTIGSIFTPKICISFGDIDESGIYPCKKLGVCMRQEDYIQPTK